MATLLLDPPMAKKADEENPYCEYASVKVDKAILWLIRAAAAVSGDKPIQEYMSDVLNEVSAKKAGQQPIKRKPPKPRA